MVRECGGLQNRKSAEKRKKNIPARVSWCEGHGNAVHVAESESVGEEGGEGLW